MNKIFKIIAFLEGMSYLLLLFVAVPIKYLSEDPQYVKMLGMPHGMLFIGYVILAFFIRSDYKWNSRQFMVVVIASVIPFGTFYVDRKYLKG